MADVNSPWDRLYEDFLRLLTDKNELIFQGGVSLIESVQWPSDHIVEGLAIKNQVLQTNSSTFVNTSTFIPQTSIAAMRSLIPSTTLQPLPTGDYDSLVRKAMVAQRPPRAGYYQPSFLWQLLQVLVGTFFMEDNMVRLLVNQSEMFETFASNAEFWPGFMNIISRNLFDTVNFVRQLDPQHQVTQTWLEEFEMQWRLQWLLACMPPTTDPMTVWITNTFGLSDSLSHLFNKNAMMEVDDMTVLNDIFATTNDITMAARELNCAFIEATWSMERALNGSTGYLIEIRLPRGTHCLNKSLTLADMGKILLPMGCTVVPVDVYFIEADPNHWNTELRGQIRQMPKWQNVDEGTSIPVVVCELVFDGIAFDNNIIPLNGFKPLQIKPSNTMAIQRRTAWKKLRNLKGGAVKIEWHNEDGDEAANQLARPPPPVCGMHVIVRSTSDKHNSTDKLATTYVDRRHEETGLLEQCLESANFQAESPFDYKMNPSDLIERRSQTARALQTWYSSDFALGTPQALQRVFTRQVRTIHIDPHVIVPKDQKVSINNLSLQEEWNHNVNVVTVGAMGKTGLRFDTVRTGATAQSFVQRDGDESLYLPENANIVGIALSHVHIIQAVRHFLITEWCSGNTALNDTPPPHVFVEIIGFGTIDEYGQDATLLESRWRAFRQWYEKRDGDLNAINAVGFYAVQQMRQPCFGDIPSRYPGEEPNHDRLEFSIPLPISVPVTQLSWGDIIAPGKQTRRKLDKVIEATALTRMPRIMNTGLPLCLRFNSFVSDAGEALFNRTYMDFSNAKKLGSGQYGVALLALWRGRLIINEHDQTRRGALIAATRWQDDLIRWHIHTHVEAQKQYDMYQAYGANECFDQKLLAWLTPPNSAPNGVGIDRLSFSTHGNVESNQEMEEKMLSMNYGLMNVQNWHHVKDILYHDVIVDDGLSSHVSTLYPYDAVVNVKLVLKSVVTTTVEWSRSVTRARQEAMLMRMLSDRLNRYIVEDFNTIESVVPVNTRIEVDPVSGKEQVKMTCDFGGVTSSNVIAFGPDVYESLSSYLDAAFPGISKRVPLSSARKLLVPCFAAGADAATPISIIPVMDYGDVKSFFNATPIDLSFQYFNSEIVNMTRLMFTSNSTYNPQVIFDLALAKNAARALDTFRPASLYERVGCMRDIVRQASYLNSIGVQHCDIHGGNILVDARRRPHVSDFGLAIVVSDPKKQVTAANRYDVFFIAGIAKTIIKTIAPWYGCSINETMAKRIHSGVLASKEFAGTVTDAGRYSAGILTNKDTWLCPSASKIPVSQCVLPFPVVQSVIKCMQFLFMLIGVRSKAAYEAAIKDKNHETMPYHPSLLIIAEEVCDLCLRTMERAAFQFWGEDVVFDDRLYRD